MGPERCIAAVEATGTVSVMGAGRATGSLGGT